jgi:hypothetical protein
MEIRHLNLSNVTRTPIHENDLPYQESVDDEHS